MQLLDSVNLSVLLVTVIFFAVSSGVIIVQYKINRRRNEIRKILIFTVGAAVAVVLESCISFGLESLRVIHVSLITAVFMFFLMYIFPLWKELNKRLVYILLLFSVIAIGLLIVKTLTPSLLIELIHLFSILIIVLLVGLLNIKYIISISK